MRATFTVDLILLDLVTLFTPGKDYKLLSSALCNILRPVHIIIIIIIWLYSPSRALASPFWGFLTITFLRGWIVSPAPNPQSGAPGLHI
jgi:hypothetical protein